MREIIPNPARPGCPGYAVEANEGDGEVLLDADGLLHWFVPDSARRIARALLQAASIAEGVAKARDGGGSASDDDLPDLH